MLLVLDIVALKPVNVSPLESERLYGELLSRNSRADPIDRHLNMRSEAGSSPGHMEEKRSH